jgi:hypothetical protein
MQTSYFNHPGLDPTDPRLVSIARWAPKGFKHVRHYQKLAPWKDMKGLTEDDFRYIYQDAILDVLDPQKVFEELGPDAILLCWEKPGEFCHRRMVAEWLEVHLGIEVSEYEAPEK